MRKVTAKGLIHSRPRPTGPILRLRRNERALQTCESYSSGLGGACDIHAGLRLVLTEAHDRSKKCILVFDKLFLQIVIKVEIKTGYK